MSEIVLALAPFAFLVGIGIGLIQHRLERRRIIKAQASMGTCYNNTRTN